MVEIVIICYLATLFGIICWGIGSSLYKLIMGEWFLAVNDSHRIAYKQATIYGLVLSAIGMPTESCLAVPMKKSVCGETTADTIIISRA